MGQGGNNTSKNKLLLFRGGSLFACRRRREMAQQIRTGWRRFLGLEGRPQGSQCWPWSRLRAQSIKGPVGLAVGMALGAPRLPADPRDDDGQQRTDGGDDSVRQIARGGDRRGFAARSAPQLLQGINGEVGVPAAPMVRERTNGPRARSWNAALNLWPGSTMAIK